jgi:hypothetical protein
LLGQAKGLLDKWGFVGKPNKSEDESAAQRSDSKKQPRSETAITARATTLFASHPHITGYDLSRTVSKTKRTIPRCRRPRRATQQSDKIEAAAQFPLRATQLNYFNPGIPAHRSNTQRR